MVLIHHEPVRVMSLTVQMRMVEGQVFVAMCEGVGIVGGPEAQHRHNTRRADGRKTQRRSRQPRARADPTRQRICHQPARMAERELRGKDRAPVGLVCGSVDDAPDGCLGQRETKAYDGP